MVPLTKLLVPVDFSPCSDAALQHALGLSELSGATIEVVHVWQPPTDYESDTEHASHSLTSLGDACEQMRQCVKNLQQAGAEVHGRLESGNACEAILHLADSGDYDLVVMGATGQTATARRGSVAERVARHAPCPVLTIHPDDLSTTHH
jgi:nucleotide-binding universal stress UspA family protein